jgi:hypothetical protein
MQVEKGNPVMFILALMALIVLILMNVSGLWLALASIIMLATFTVGVGFSRYIPNVHLSEFADALHHQEVLPMAHVPAVQAPRVETHGYTAIIPKPSTVASVGLATRCRSSERTTVFCD